MEIGGDLGRYEHPTEIVWHVVSSVLSEDEKRKSPYPPPLALRPRALYRRGGYGDF